MRTVYFAATFTRAWEMRDYRDDIEKLGWEVTSSWIEARDGTPALGQDELTEPGLSAAPGVRSKWHADLSTAVKAATDNMSDLFRATTLMLFTRSPSTSGGYHTELGMALASGKDIIIIGPVLNVFQALPRIRRFDTFRDFLESERGNHAA